MLNNNIKEEWKPVISYEEYYEVSNTGKVRVKRTKKEMKFYKINSGYYCIKFSVNSKRKSFLVHRLVAQHFCEDYKGTYVVNHKDGNKENNIYTNLEKTTQSENCQHAYDTDLSSTEKCKSYIGRKHARSTTKYHNVSKKVYMYKGNVSSVRYIARVTHNGVILGKAIFATEEEAALHVNKIIDEYNLDRPKNII